jgi:hypothetical protein
MAWHVHSHQSYKYASYVYRSTIGINIDVQILLIVLELIIRS